jgi:hypothetical protein
VYHTVVAFAPLSDGKIFVELNNGKTGVFDMRPYMESDFFKSLKNDAYFQRAYIEYGVITWPNGQDISPATISIEMKSQPCPPEGILLRRASTREYA